MTGQRKKLAILLWSATPERPQLCATPFVHAAGGAALLSVSHDLRLARHFERVLDLARINRVAAVTEPTP